MTIWAIVAFANFIIVCLSVTAVACGHIMRSAGLRINRNGKVTEPPILPRFDPAETLRLEHELGIAGHGEGPDAWRCFDCAEERARASRGRAQALYAAALASNPARAAGCTEIRSGDETVIWRTRD